MLNATRCVELGERPLTIEDVVAVARAGAAVTHLPRGSERIALGRRRLDEVLARGERIYGVNTGIGGNVEDLARARTRWKLLQAQHGAAARLRHRAAAARDVVRAATLLRIATFLPGASGVRVELVDALAALLNRGVTPVVPRYGIVGASGDLMPSAYIARVLVGKGEAEFAGPAHGRARRRSGGGWTRAAALCAQRGARPDERHHVHDGGGRAGPGGRVPRAAGAARRRSRWRWKRCRSPALPFQPWVHERRDIPGRSPSPPICASCWRAAATHSESGGQSMYSLRCPPQGLGQVWEALADGRAVVEREINSLNDNPLIDPETGVLYKAGNFYGGHIARLLDTWKIDFASMANWGNALMAVLVDDRFSQGLPANLTPEAGRQFAASKGCS